jgi:membrane-bound lytic murein transglycosylase D
VIKTFKKHISLLLLCICSILAKGDNPYQQRLASLHYTMPLPYNDYVKKYIDAYVNNPDSTATIIKIWNEYEATIQQQLKANHQPEELRYLALALSGMNMNATNAYGCAGLWQLMFNDAKDKYELKVTSLVDERRDPLKSTVAACSYFKDLMTIYNDWMLAIAAFTSSPANVNKAIINAGVNMNYWSIHPFLPAESRDAVPRFVAAVYIANFYTQHHIVPEKHLYTYEFDSVWIDKECYFDQIGNVLNISNKQLEFLNPVYKKGKIPFSESKYILRLPKGRAADFQNLKNRIYTSPVIVKPDTTIKRAFIPKDTSAKKHTPDAPELSRVMYKVKKGETLTIISDYFDCPVSMAKYWNHLKGKRPAVAVGKLLYFYVPTDKRSEYEKVNTMTAAQKAKLARKD